MTSFVDLDAVEKGCSVIDNALERYATVIKKISDAAGYLGTNSLRFGDINSSLDEQLEILMTQIEECSAMNVGLTSTIRSNAQAQYSNYINEQNRMQDQQMAEDIEII